MKLEILYEDNHLIVAVKPTGILSQEDYTKDPDMLNILKTYIKEKYHKPGNVYLGLVMRLDRMTSGIMVFARTSKAASRLSEQIKNHEIKKQYLAIVEGITKQSETLKHYLVKDEKLVKSFVSNEGKLAVLNYEKISTIDNLSLVKVNLQTGRHHQIRVQFSNIGHPLYGDHLYGGHGEIHMQLHAYKLSFLHPISKERLEFTNIPNGEIWDKFNLNNCEL